MGEGEEEHLLTLHGGGQEPGAPCHHPEVRLGEGGGDLGEDAGEGGGHLQALTPPSSGAPLSTSPPSARRTWPPTRRLCAPSRTSETEVLFNSNRISIELIIFGQ